MSAVLLANSGIIIFGVCMIVCILYCLICMRCRRGHAAVPQPVLPVSAGDVTATRDAGLSQPAIDALPSFAYHAESKDVDDDNYSCAGSDHCAVCLSLVAEGEMVRLLPDCGHSFHVECIDVWLHAHSLCPVCRAEAKPASPPEEVEKKAESCGDGGGSPPAGLV